VTTALNIVSLALPKQDGAKEGQGVATGYVTSQFVKEVQELAVLVIHELL
jgi:hypothetical protein